MDLPSITKDGKIFIITSNDSNDWQNWKIIQSDGDHVKIQHSIKKGYITVEKSDGSLFLSQDNYNNLQDWLLKTTDNGYLRLVNREYGILTSEMNGTVGNGKQIDDVNYMKYQLWKIEKI